MTTRIAKLADPQHPDGRWVLLQDRQGDTQGYVVPLPEGIDLSALLRLSGERRRALIAATLQADCAARTDDGSLPLLAPLDSDTEVWAAGVTYQASRQARMGESADSDVYARVYDADRPELFFKSIGWRVRGPGSTIGIRQDSSWNVPEPELAVVVDASGEIAGYTICNDVSSRSIEGENPLYLPQAKLFRGSCAVGPWIVPEWEIPDAYALAIRIRIDRGIRPDRNAEPLWQGATSTARLHRRLDELVSWLYRCDVFPCGAILSTGTCVVPDDSLTLEPGDLVSIVIDGIGTLRNTVSDGPAGFADQPGAGPRGAELVVSA